MGEQIPRSPNNAGPGHPRWRETTSNAHPSLDRADNGHLGPHSAGKGWTPTKLRDPEMPIPPVNDRRK